MTDPPKFILSMKLKMLVVRRMMSTPSELKAEKSHKFSMKIHKYYCKVFIDEKNENYSIILYIFTIFSKRMRITVLFCIYSLFLVKWIR